MIKLKHEKDFYFQDASRSNFEPIL